MRFQKLYHETYRDFTKLRQIWGKHVLYGNLNIYFFEILNNKVQNQK